MLADAQDCAPVDELSLWEKQCSLEGQRACQCDSTSPNYSRPLCAGSECPVTYCNLVLPQVPHKHFMSVSQLCCCREERSRQDCWQTVQDLELADFVPSSPGWWL